VDPDYPFYNGQPVQLTGAQWTFVMLMVVLGFASLVWPALASLGGSGGFVGAVLFSAFPLLGLALVAPRQWTALFRRVGLRELGWMVAFALLNIVVSMAVGAVVVKTVGASANPAILTAVAADGQGGIVEARGDYLCVARLGGVVRRAALADVPVERSCSRS
jgi:hypothetical protein